MRDQSNKSKHVIVVLVTLLATFAIESLRAEQQIGVLFYDVGRLYDTIPSRFYDDSFYTPKGRKQWGDSRYRHKVSQITTVIDSLKLPIVVLYGVENDSVLRDIQRASRLDYSAIHRSIDYYDGLDYAILYYGDILHIERIYSNNYYIYVGGDLLGRTIEFHLTRRGDRLLSTVPPDAEPPAEITIAWGRISHDDTKRLELADPLHRYEQQGQGDTWYNNHWYLNSRIGIKTSEDIELTRSGIYISKFLLNKSQKQPLPTFYNNGYAGGYSRHLPSFLYLQLEGRKP